MSISISKFVSIVSGVGAGVAVQLRELIGRLFTTNPLAPTKTVLEFGSADEVGQFFGFSSEEYRRALKYFSWISKSTTRAKTISFARWAQAGSAPQIWGAKYPSSVTAWAGITDGAFSITIGGVTKLITELDFTGVTTLAGVATIIQAAVNAEDGAMWENASVTWDPVRGSFNFTGGLTGEAAISADPLPDEVILVEGGVVFVTEMGLAISVEPPPSGTDILVNTLLSWSAEAIFSAGSTAESLSGLLSGSSDLSTNFGSFLFIPVLTLNQIIEVAAWNAAQNVKYQYMVPVSSVDDFTDYNAALLGYAGTAVTYVPTSGDFAEMGPMIVLAATDYTRPNAVQNYMYQMFPLFASTVKSDALSSQADALRINYVGETQTAGQKLAFYQRGVLMGGASDPVDMNVYANEQWLKDYLAVGLLQLLLTLNRVSANTQGEAETLSIVQDGIDQALLNGTISVGKPLSAVDKAYITQVTNDPRAWHQVQGIGYWVDTRIEPYAVDGRTEYKAVYLLIYAKDDAVRKIEGTHTLI